MDEQDQVGPVVTLVVALAIAVSLFTIAVALAVSGLFASADGATAAASTADDAIVARIRFADGSSDLPDTAGSALFMIVVAAVVDPTRHIEVSGYRDTHGRVPVTADLAEARLRAVHDALRAAGIPDARIDMRRVTERPSGTDDAQARRVELVLH